MVSRINTKTIASISVFTAISIALVISPLKFSAPFAPFLKYQIWEIPIVAAFLIFGPFVGLSTLILNTFVLLVLFPGGLPTGPLYNFAAASSMLLGVYLTQIFARRSSIDFRIMVLIATALGGVFRVVFMSIVNWAFLRYPFPIGYDMPVEVIIGMLPIIGLFNATVTLYTIPLGYIISKASEGRIGAQVN
jgi:riboflavin transporter FmnP